MKPDFDQIKDVVKAAGGDVNHTQRKDCGKSLNLALVRLRGTLAERRESPRMTKIR